MFYSKIFARQVLTTYVLYITVPVLMKNQTSRNGTADDPNVGYFKDLWINKYIYFLLFISLLITRHFFNVSKSPMREVCYSTLALGALSIDIALISSNTLFLGLCSYIVALYKELQQMLECFERNSKLNIKSLSDCIEFQLAIIRYDCEFF